MNKTPPSSRRHTNAAESVPLNQSPVAEGGRPAGEITAHQEVMSPASTPAVGGSMDLSDRAISSATSTSSSSLVGSTELDEREQAHLFQMAKGEDGFKLVYLDALLRAVGAEAFLGLRDEHGRSLYEVAQKQHNNPMIKWLDAHFRAVQISVDAPHDGVQIAGIHSFEGIMVSEDPSVWRDY
ncbi:MAG: hypothetical protein B7X06_03220, partial [Verrucomicrobia bacterium 21-51-4]